MGGRMDPIENTNHVPATAAPSAPRTPVLVVVGRLLLVPIPILLVAFTFLGGYACAFGGGNNYYCRFNLHFSWLTDATAIVALVAILKAGRYKPVHWSAYAVFAVATLASVLLVFATP